MTMTITMTKAGDIAGYLDTSGPRALVGSVDADQGDCIRRAAATAAKLLEATPMLKSYRSVADTFQKMLNLWEPAELHSYIDDGGAR